MSQLQPTVTEPAALPLSAAAPRQVGRVRLPGWVALLLRNPKSRFGLVLVCVHGRRRVDRAADLGQRPDRLQRQRDRGRRLRGTTSSARPTRASDIFSQVMLGARRSLILGAAAAVLATVLATVLGILAAYSGGIVDEIINFLTNVFLVVPTIPLLIVDLELPEVAGDDDDDPRPRPDALGVRGTHPARAGAVAEEPRLRAGGEGRRRVDVAHRLRRADAEHDQPHRRGASSSSSTSRCSSTPASSSSGSATTRTSAGE